MSDDDRTLRVAEVFGPTYQGEGPSAGRPAVFVRLSGCNLDCRWCDTPYTWDWQGKNGRVYDPKVEARRVELGGVVADVLERAGRVPSARVVLTGGEPLAQRSRAAELARLLDQLTVACEVETNGTVEPYGFPESTTFNVSPKLASSGVDRERRFVPDVLAVFARLAPQRACFKFVVTGPADLDEVDDVVGECGLPVSSVWVMPEGRVAADLCRTGAAVADAALERGYNLSHRLHVLLWGDERGR